MPTTPNTPEGVQALYGLERFTHLTALARLHAQAALDEDAAFMKKALEAEVLAHGRAEAFLEAVQVVAHLNTHAEAQALLDVLADAP